MDLNFKKYHYLGFNKYENFIFKMTILQHFEMYGIELSAHFTL